MCISAASLRPGCGVTSPDNQSPNSAVYIQLDIIVWRLHYLQQTWNTSVSGFTRRLWARQVTWRQRQLRRLSYSSCGRYVSCHHSMWMSDSVDSESYVDYIYTAGTFWTCIQQVSVTYINRKTNEIQWRF